MSAPRIHPDRTALLVLDLQEKLLTQIRDGEAVVQRCATLIRGCAALGIPTMATEQYPQGLGPTVEPIRRVLPEETPCPKVRFSAGVEGVRDRLAEWDRSMVLVCGIETHVCVLQTALDLMEIGYATAVAGDAVGSRRREDHDLAMRRMTAAGATPVSVEMALLEMVREAGTDRFKAILPMIR